MHWISVFCCMLLFSVPATACLAQALVSGKPISSLMASYSPYDMDGNGTREIESLSFLPFEAPGNQEVPLNGPLVLVLVEPRLLQDLTTSPYSRQDLLNRLERWKGELRAEGYYTRFIAAQVYNGTAHQDGRTVLALRRFFKEVRASYPNFRGAMLVGSFPEAMLVREWLWRREKTGSEVLTVKGKAYTNVEYIRQVPERIAHRTDIVLGDLDGGWERVYHQAARNVKCLVAIPDKPLPAGWPQAGTGPASTPITSSAYEEFDSESMEDFFYVKDAKTEVLFRESARIQFRAYPNQHPELSPADGAQLNPTALPELVVSRINARHVAFSLAGSGLVDDKGIPQVYEGREIDLDTAYKADPVMERRLLIEYFDRNHLHRVGGYDHLPLNLAVTASKDFKASDGRGFLAAASSTWNEQKEFDQANLEGYVAFLKYNAVLKGYRTHGSRTAMYFYNTYDPLRLLALTGTPYRWAKKLYLPLTSKWRYTPSYADKSGEAEWGLHRTLWEHKKLAAVRPAFYYTSGCEANSPSSSETLPYNHVNYGQLNNAENILFFLNGLAMVTRAKTFYDDANGLPEALSKTDNANLGHGWIKHYHYVVTHTPNSQASGKRSYWWSVLGDWTLRLRYTNGVAVMGLKKSSTGLESRAVLADRTVIGNHTSSPGQLDMNMQNQTLLPAGDVNNDGHDDFLVLNRGGIGVAYQDGLKWQTLLDKPTGAAFGGWNYTAGSTGDKIAGHGDFDGDGRHEILIRNASRLGILRYDDVFKSFASVVADPVGTAYADQGVSWTHQSSDVVEAIADFNGDKTDDILIRGSKGRVVLSLRTGKLYPLVVVAYGTGNTGGPNGRAWVHTSLDKFAVAADFSAARTKSIVLTNAINGMAVLNVSNSLKNKFQVQNTFPPRTTFGAWLFEAAETRIEAAGDFTRDGVDELLVTGPNGIGLLTPLGGTVVASFNSLVSKPRGTSLGGWVYSPTNRATLDKIIGLGDFNNDGATDILIQHPQRALGILTFYTPGGPFGDVLGSTFQSRGMLFYNDNYLTKPIDGWYPKPEDVIVNVGNYDGLPGAELLVYRKNMVATTARAVPAEEATEEAPKDPGSRLYPNPATGHLLVKSQGQEVAFAEVYTLTGTRVLGQPVNGPLDVSALPPGTYLVLLKNAQGVCIAREKLVKQ